MFFGKRHCDRTFVLKRVEGELLQVESEGEGFAFELGSCDSAFTVRGSSLFATAAGVFDRVHKFTLEKRKWKEFAVGDNEYDKGKLGERDIEGRRGK